MASPTRNPVNAPGPVPTTIAAEVAEADPRRAEHAVDPAEELLAVAVAGAPRRLGGESPVGRADADDRKRRGRVEDEDRTVGGGSHAARSR